MITCIIKRGVWTYKSANIKVEISDTIVCYYFNNKLMLKDALYISRLSSTLYALDIMRTLKDASDAQALRLFQRMQAKHA